MAKKTAKPERHSAPSHLSEESARWWRGVVGEFNLQEHQLRLLQAAAESWDRAQAARELIQREGLTVTDRYNTAKAHPAAAIERDARAAFCRIVSQLGLDAADNPDIQVKP